MNIRDDIMGERIIRPGIRTSEAVAENIRKGGWMSGVMYVWLLTIVDDYGRYDARPAILISLLNYFIVSYLRDSLKNCISTKKYGIS